MPLALELAAAQLRLLSPGDLAARLDDRFRLLSSRRDSADGRHRTLRTAVEWSYELCDKLERRLWERVSVFACEFDLEAVEAVCCDELVTSADVVDVVRGLVDKSILSVRAADGMSRLRLLDTLRHYGLDRLREEGDGTDATLDELALRARHLAWYSDLSCRFEAEWIGPHQRDRLARVRAELPEIRAALAFALEHPEHLRTGLRMAAALCWFWGTTAALREGHTWLVRLLDVGRDPCQERSRALSALAVLMVTVGAPEGGVEVAREALALARTHDPNRVPRVLDNVGMMQLAYGDPGALAVLQESTELCRAGGRRDAELAFSTYALGYGLGVMRRTEESEELFAESIALCQELGDAWWQGVVRIIAALLAWAPGDLDTAETHAVEGLRVCRLVPDLHACAVALNIIALVRVGRDDAQAARLLGTAERYWSDAGGSMLEIPVWIELVHSATQRCRTALGAEKFEEAYRAGQDDQLEEAAARTLGEPVRSATGPLQEEVLGLTRREREVVELVADGLSNREIADRLVISPRTAETHVQNMLAKTGFRTRSRLAVWYRDQQPAVSS
jgi:DNA-binding CsgD family transcriptional regulator